MKAQVNRKDDATDFQYKITKLNTLHTPRKILPGRYTLIDIVRSWQTTVTFFGDILTRWCTGGPECVVTWNHRDSFGQYFDTVVGWEPGCEVSTRHG